MHNNRDILLEILHDGTPKRAFFTAVIVGSILTSINHGDRIMSGDFPPSWKMMLTYAVPFCVTIWGTFIGKKTASGKDVR